MQDQNQQAKQESTAIAPINREPWLNMMPGKVYTSMPVETREHKIAMVRALQSEDVKAAEMIGERIEIVHVLVHEVELPDQQTGELRPCKRVVLVGPKGERLSSVSEGVLNSLRAFAAAFGPPPWNPPIACRMKEAKGKGVNRFYILEIEA